jgi:ATP-dependent DNA helicase RecQ
VLHCSGGARHRALARLALRVRRPGIIYCSTTREVDEIHAVLQRFGVPSHRYHGKMSSSERSKNQDAFMQRGRRTVMVATNAFGLGIDKPDIRYVMHYQAPASLEQYVQEAGRAGRDGRRANCIMLYSPEDRAIHEALLARSRVRPEQLYKLGTALAAWASEEKVPNLESLALSAELGTRTTGALLALLEEATLVRWDAAAVYVTVPANEIEARSRELAGQFETLRTQDARRLDAVAAYAMHQDCRACFLREYFGESEMDGCGMCDRCRGQEDRPESFWEPLAPPKVAKDRDRKRRSTRGRTSRGASRRSEDKPGKEAKSGRRRGRRRGSRGRRGRRSTRRSEPTPSDSTTRPTSSS